MDNQIIPLTLEEWDKAGKSAETLRKEHFQEESAKRVERFFIVPNGTLWLLYHITDIPASPDDSDFLHLMRSKYGFTSADGQITMVSVRPYFTRDDAWNAVHAEMSEMQHMADMFDNGVFYSHVYEMDKL